MIHKRIKINCFIQNILMFFLIFGFPIIPFINSVKIIMGITILFLLLGISACFFYRKFFSFELTVFNFLYSLFFVLTLLLTIFTRNLDFSLSIKILSSQIMILICILFMSFLNINIEESIWKCFIVQSVIILLCIFSQTFYDLTSPFRAEMAEHHIAAYGRMRGNAIAGYQFFGISTMYGFVIIWGILNIQKSLKYILQLLLIIVCGCISGRYCITSVLIGIMVKLALLIREKKVKYVIGILFAFVLAIGIGVLAVFKISENIKDPLAKKIFDNYIVKPVESIFSENGFESDSTNVLKEMYELDISDYLLLGEGKYSNEDGSYFGHIDIGYYRIILYYGIWGIIWLFILYFLFIWFGNKTVDKSLKIAFFLFFVVLNFKGDVQLYSNNILPLLVGYCYFGSKKMYEVKNRKNKISKVAKYILK